jgi:prepilin-type processing-associated H-X9-DG protein
MKRMLCLGIIVSIMGLTSILAPSAGTDQVKLSRASGVPFAILDRVFPFKYKGEGGTCFVIDMDDRQYIITARHLVPGMKSGESVQLYISKEWSHFKINPIFPANDKSDIAALAADRLIVPKMDLLVGTDGIIIGQDTYFLGFPDLPPTPYLKISTLVRGRHFPFVKNATLSAIDPSPDAGNVLYLDGHNNPGFSGGPVIVANHNKEESLQIVGVVSGYYPQNVRVKEKQAKEPRPGTRKMKTDVTPYVPENSGIVISFSMAEIVKAIQSNPIGFPLPAANKN